MVRESRRRGIRHESKVYFAEEFIHSHLYFLNRLLYIQVYHERSPDAFYYIIGRGSKKNTYCKIDMIYIFNGNVRYFAQCIFYIICKVFY